MPLPGEPGSGADPPRHPLKPSQQLQALKDSRWRNAMSDEFNALLRNGTWDLVPPNSSENLVGCKWVFRIKRKPDGSVDKFKARLVAKPKVSISVLVLIILIRLVRSLNLPLFALF